MKNYVVYLCFLLLLAGQAVQAQEQEQQEFTVPLSKSGERAKITVDIKNGPVTVKGTSRKDVLVRVVQSGAGKSKEKDKESAAGDGLKKISGGIAEVEVSERNNEVEIEAENWARGIDLYLEVPLRSDLEVQSYNNGNIRLENIEGELVVESFNGGITAEGISGSLVANTYNGAIKVSFNSVKPNTPLAFTTFNGGIDLSLPASIKANFKARSDFGEIYTGFDLKMAPAEFKNSEQGGVTKRTLSSGWVTGSANGGGPEILLKNYHGDIYIRKK